METSQNDSSKVKLAEDNTEEKKENIENEKNTTAKGISGKTRMVLVILFILLFAGVTYVFLRGSYLEYKELG